MKKKLTFAAVFAASILTVTAQINNGVVLVGGSISLSSNTSNNGAVNNETKNNFGQFNINIGKAFKQNNVVGVYGSYGRGKNENLISANVINTSKTTNGGAGVFYRHYKPLGKNFYFFSEANIGFNGTKQVRENRSGNNVSTITDKSTGVNLGLTPGVSYQVYKKVQLEILMPQIIGFSFGNTKSTTSTNSNVGESKYFQFSTGLSGGLVNNLAVGFRLIL
jgi:hypothetical protein